MAMRPRRRLAPPPPAPLPLNPAPRRTDSTDRQPREAAMFHPSLLALALTLLIASSAYAETIFITPAVAPPGNGITRCRVVNAHTTQTIEFVSHDLRFQWQRVVQSGWRPRNAGAAHDFRGCHRFLWRPLLRRDARARTEKESSRLDLHRGLERHGTHGPGRRIPEHWRAAEACDYTRHPRGLGVGSLPALNSRFPTGPPASVRVGTTLLLEERMPTRRARSSLGADRGALVLVQVQRVLVLVPDLVRMRDPARLLRHPGGGLRDLPARIHLTSRWGSSSWWRSSRRSTTRWTTSSATTWATWSLVSESG